MLDSCAKLRNVHIVANKAIRDRTEDSLVPDVEMMIEFASPSVFRISLGEYWVSYNGTYTSDGKTLKLDGDFTELRNAPANILGIGDSFTKGGGTHNLLFEFMRGRKAADLIPDDADIKATPSGFKAKTKEFGDIEVTLIKRDGLSLPMIVDVSNLAGRMAAYRFIPVFVPRPEQPLERYVFDYTFVRSFPRGTFDTRVPKGIPFSDKRKKGGD